MTIIERVSETMLDNIVTVEIYAQSMDLSEVKNLYLYNTNQMRNTMMNDEYLLLYQHQLSVHLFHHYVLHYLTPIDSLNTHGKLLQSFHSNVNNSMSINYN